MTTHEPNRQGFSGGATAPEPKSGGRRPTEDVALPSDDLTNPVTPDPDEDDQDIADEHDSVTVAEDDPIDEPSEEDVRG